MRNHLLIVCVLTAIGCTAQATDSDTSESPLLGSDPTTPPEGDGKPPLPPPPCGPRCFTEIVGEARECIPVELLHKRAFGFCMEHRSKLVAFRPLGACPPGRASIARLRCCAPPPPPPPPCPPGEKCPPPPPPPGGGPLEKPLPIEPGEIE